MPSKIQSSIAVANGCNGTDKTGVKATTSYCCAPTSEDLNTAIAAFIKEVRVCIEFFGAVEELFDYC